MRERVLYRVYSSYSGSSECLSFGLCIVNLEGRGITTVDMDKKKIMT